MPALLSLVTSVKDYIEIAHKLVETQNSNPFLGSNSLNAVSDNFLAIRDYTEFGAVLTYVVLSIKEFLINFLSFGWLNNIWSLPLIVPDIASAMISEISVLDSYFTNAFSFLENGMSNTLQSNAHTIGMATDNLVAIQKANQNPFLFGFEKFIIGLLNSLFLFLPTSTAHLITVRRFVMQGIEAGFLAGLGTIAGNFLWLASIILGLRFIVIPWLSLDIFRYVLGFLLLVKYLWDSSKELNKTTKTNIDDNGKIQIFLLNFLLALTEQTSIYPFISNMSFGPEGSIIEGFSGTLFQSENGLQFFGIHMCYLLGILLGSFSLLQFTVWFWENPAFTIYMWLSSKPAYRFTTSAYYKVLNFVFLYLTMLCAISSIPYFGLDYTITNPLGFIPQDRMISQKSDPTTGGGEPILQETSFLGVKPTDKNSRIKEGVHARRERWKERLVKYQAFDASLYDQGVYDVLTVEDLNYGFDRFWLRRKMRNHQIRFRLFPGPWMRSVKKQLNKPGFTGPRMEFFRILFEQYYHPSFHSIGSKDKVPSRSERTSLKPNSGSENLNLVSGAYATQRSNSSIFLTPQLGSKTDGLNNLETKSFKKQKGLVNEYSALRKFVRNVNTRVNSSLATSQPGTLYPDTKKYIYSKSFKSLFNSINKEFTKENLKTFRDLSKNLLIPKATKELQVDFTNWGQEGQFSQNQGKLPVWKTQEKNSDMLNTSLKQLSIRKKLSKKERLLFIQKAQIYNAISQNSPNNNVTTIGRGAPEPLNYYFQKNEAFKRKLKYYSTISTRKFAVGNNAPYFKSLLKRSFFYYKPSLRLKRTLFTASLRRGFRKKSVTPKKLLYTTNSLTSSNELQNKTNGINDTIAKSGWASGASLGMANEAYSSMSELNTNSNLGKTANYSATSQYSVLGKRASRYRYQIYKDVLQHWYYSPFNRLLLKFDVDSFMNRQPKAHFVTKNEERLLHLRRVLLAEHYNTLRWYTYMQHYRTMKSRIGGAKSFASGSYNQQFQGTFKKIRHLFAITPSQADQTGNLSVLKFDQPLFNESNQSKNFVNPVYPPQGQYEQPELSVSGGNKGSSAGREAPLSKTKITSSPYKHEDLSKNNSSSKNSQVVGETSLKTGQDFIDISLTVTSQYVKSEQLNKINQIKQYINEKNYSSITNLLANPEIASGIASQTTGDNSPSNKARAVLSSDSETYTKTVLLDLLKQAKVRLNDQTFLKNYISHRMEKREQRSKSTSKEVAAQLASLKTWLSPIAGVTSMSTSQNGQNSVDLTTGARKALNDGVFVLNKINPAIQTKSFMTKQTSSLKISNQGPNSSKYYIKLDSEKQIKHALTSLKELNAIVKKLEQTSGTERNSKVKDIIRNNVSLSRTVMNTILKPFFVLQNGILAKRNTKNLEWWRQKQRSVTKRKSSRKKARAKNIKQVYQKAQPNTGGGNDMVMQRRYEDWKESNRGVLDSNPPIQISTLLSSNSGITNLRKKRVDQDSSDAQKSGWSTILGGAKRTFNNYFLFKFRKKASSKGRRYRNMSMSRGFAYVRKPKNINSFTTIPEYLNSFETVLSAKAINNITKTYSQDSLQKPLLSKEEKAVFLKDFKAKLTKIVINNSSTTKDTNFNNLKNLLIQGQIKKSVGKKRSKRTWKKRKRQKFTKNHYKYRKRQLHGLGKLRVLMKKVKRVKATQEFQHWWWNRYLPKMVNSKSINSTKAAGARSDLSRENSSSQASGPSFKPLSSTKALEIRSNLYPNNSYMNNNKSEETTLNSTKAQINQNVTDQSMVATNTTASNQNTNILDKIYTNFVDTTFGGGAPSSSLTDGPTTYNPKYNVTTTIPFYAGWDESLRKFVVTNRILSRRDAGFETNINSIFGQDRAKMTNGQNQQVIQFNQAPLKGLNEASYLYLQTEMPFNSYIIDQFIPNNQSFYAPLGWSRFQFRHTLLNQWVQKTKSSSSTQQGNPSLFLKSNTNFDYFNFMGAFGPKAMGTVGFGGSSKNKESSKLQNRRIKKRYSLLKQSPINLSYVPSGTLLAETLPSHYISVFDKQARMPRTRYIKRNLPKANLDSNVKDLAILDYSTNLANQNMFGQETVNLSASGATLRKRIKPKRKYHKKRFAKKDGLVFPRRRKFGINEYNTTKNSQGELATSVDSNFRLRPSTRINQTSVKALSSKSKKGRTPAKTNPVRLRQLRRREFQQVFKPLQRFQPRYGGFTWPGDYLRLESIPMPKLDRNLNLLEDTTNVSKVSSNQAKLKRKINVQPIGLLPRKYLLQKHNLKVFKKKLALKYIG